MYTFLYLSFQYPRALGLIVVGDFQDMSGIYPIIMTASHDMIPVHIKFENGDLSKALWI